ncbi:MAG: hypothetical protein GC168_14580 [Candidatus Hydrogenedens sp.]|nr:hypothetical protein [Candidatus Hydrogenedens sp.]
MRKFTFLFCAIGLLAASAGAQEIAEAAGGSFALTLIMRWVHVLSAITMLGGSLFMRLVLKGALTSLPQAERETLAAAVRKRWKMFVMLLTTLLLVSGFYNYLMVTRHAHEGEGTYHMLFGIKFLLSLGVFTLAMFLIGSSGLAKKTQANDKLFLTLLALMGVGVVLIAGYMKVM